MLIDVVLLPRDLRAEHLAKRTVIVFDVLRATTSMLAALAAGVREIRTFADLESAINAAHGFSGPHLLCGERHAVKPPGFDLGNSPGAFQADLHRGQTLFMSTTNGTRALLAARGAEKTLIGALVNADIVADAAAQTGLDLTLLCSGTEGFVSAEDLLGAGAVIDRLKSSHSGESCRLESDIAWMAWQLFRSQRDRLPFALRATRGGHNIIRANLEPDIDFCANLNAVPVVGIAGGEPLSVRRWP